MAGEALGVAGAGCCGFLVLLLAFSFSVISPTEMALRHNYVFQQVSPDVLMTPGLKFIGPFSRLIRYPRTVQSIEYNTGHRDLLDGRTKDGLPLILGVAFQYRLQPDGIYNLYRAYDNKHGDYEAVLKLTGIHVVTEVATKFTAYNFFNEKPKIAEAMRRQLDSIFREKFYASVDSLQILDDDLPDAFTNTIVKAATSKQNVTRTRKTLDAKVISFQTLQVIAEAQANVTVQKATGDVHRILQNARADAAIIEAYVEAELQAYGKIQKDLNLHGDALLKYIWYDTLSGGGVADRHEDRDVQMFVGVSPAAYISPESAR